MDNKIKFKTYKGIRWRIENDPKKREQAIKLNVPVRFEIEHRNNPDEGPKVWDSIRTFDSYGKKAVQKHNDRILKYSEKHNLDPDIVRSVMYAENARGHYVVLNKLGDITRKSDSILPINIQKDKWSKLVGKKPEDMYDPDINIEASTVLLKRIAERIDNPTPEKVGSIWNYMGREKTNEFGEYVGKIYRKKPWREID